MGGLRQVIQTLQEMSPTDCAINVFTCTFLDTHFKQTEESNNKTTNQTVKGEIE